MQTQEFETKGFQLIELPIPASVTTIGQRVSFTNQSNLQSISGSQVIYIRQLETYIDQVVPNGPFFNNPVATATRLPLAMLVLNIAGFEKYQYIPLPRLNIMYSDPDPAVVFGPYSNQPFRLKKVCMVDWEKSYVQFVGTPPAAAFSYLFGVHYEPWYFINGQWVDKNIG